MTLLKRLTRGKTAGEAALFSLRPSVTFNFPEQKNFYLPGPRPMTYTYQGVASVV